MRRKAIKIYVGCALTGAPKKYIRFVAEVKRLLTERNKDSVRILEFLGLFVGDDLQVYEHDMKMVLKSDFLVMFADHLSTGAGQELEGFIRDPKQNGPFLVVCDYRRKPSRMPTGAVKKWSKRGQFSRYTTAKNVVVIIEEFMRTHPLLKKFKYV